MDKERLRIQALQADCPTLWLRERRGACAALLPLARPCRPPDDCCEGLPGCSPRLPVARPPPARLPLLLPVGTRELDAPCGRPPLQAAHQRSQARCPPVTLAGGAPGSESRPQKTSPPSSRQQTLRSYFWISRAHSVQGAEQPGEPSARKRKMQTPPPKRLRT